MEQYKSRVELRHYPIDGVNDWYVRKEDTAFESIADGWRDMFKEMYLKNVEHKGVVVQAGAYNGLFPRLFSNIFSQVYTFEPDALSFYCAVNNCQEYNIHLLNAFVSDRHGLAGLVLGPETNPGMNRIHEPVAGTFGTVPKLMIDDLMLNRCDLIQLDLEGHEIFALRGAYNTIKAYRPVIAVEDATADIDVYLNQFGYARTDTVGRDSLYRQVYHADLTDSTT